MRIGRPRPELLREHLMEENGRHELGRLPAGLSGCWSQNDSAHLAPLPSPKYSYSRIQNSWPRGQVLRGVIGRGEPTAFYLGPSMQISNRRAHGPFPSRATARPRMEGALWLFQPFYQSPAPTGHFSSPEAPQPAPGSIEHLSKCLV